MDVSAAPRPTITQVFLGLFISWQLLFLPAANYLAFFPHGDPEEGELSDSRSGPDPTGSGGALPKAIDLAARVTDGWSFLTGQVQAWWLFAPEFPRQAIFPAVELRWDDDTELAASLPPLLALLAAADELQSIVLWTGLGTADSMVSSRSQTGVWEREHTIPPVRLRTVIEPNDPQSYFHPPGSFDRLFHYEVRLGLILSNWNEQSVRAHPQIWREDVENRVRRQWKSMRAYLRWYVQHFRREHPQLPPPKQAVLLMRIYRTPETPQKCPVWQGPLEQPLARWQLGATRQPGELPVEMFDLVERRFVVLKSKD